MSETIVEVESLTRRFGAKLALDNVSLQIPRGIVLGLVGENGAGKTTLIKHLLGLLKAQQGRVSVFGKNPVDDPVGVLGQIGYLSEDRDMPDWMKVGELLRYSQAFYPNWDEVLAEELRQTFELNLSQKIKSLSRGQRARAGLLVALAHRPPLLVLDEPSSGLDPIVRRDILSAIIRTVADEGRNVLFSSHLLDEVERVADSVAMIHQGRIVLTDSLDDVISRHYRLTLRFNKPQAVPPVLPGALSCRGERLEWTVVCNGELEQVKSEAESLGAQILEETNASLDEVFVAKVSATTSAAQPNVNTEQQR